MAAVALDFGRGDTENAGTPSPNKLVADAAPRPAGDEADEDADAAFARLVAEQERAFFIMRGGNAGDLVDDDAAAAAAAPESEGEGEEDPDVAFARALQEEETREWNARMHALAGLPPPGEGGAADGAGDGGADAYASDEAEEDGVDVDGMTYEELLALGDAAGHVSRGCSATALAALPQSAYSAAAHAAAGGAEQCAVCRVEYEVGDAVTTLPCAHFYHAACLRPWLQRVRICPCCKRDAAPAATPGRAPPAPTFA